MSATPSPPRVAVVNDYALVVAGLASVLAPYADRVRVVEIDSGLPVRSEVDLVLYDTFGQVQGDGVDLEDLVAGTDARVVIFSWNTQPDLVERALERGAVGYVSKTLDPPELVSLLERVHRGEVVRPPLPSSYDRELGTWPGQDHGLSAREAEVLALICQGLSNQQIATKSYLSINSVKTYIRTAYRKIGVTSRSQAVIWGLAHGLAPDRLRVLDPEV